MIVEPPYLLFLGDAPDQLAAKTANGIAYWRRDWCVGQLRLPDCQADLGLLDLTLEQARKAGAKTLVIGVANRGGVVSPLWLQTLLQGLDLGLDLASGLHRRLTAIPELADRAAARGRRLIDVRHPDQAFPVATGARRSGHRLLTVGTDCSVGKMFTALALERELQHRGIRATFRATGQTGIFIAGGGVSVDAVVADFIAGAAEWLAPANEDDHWDLVEGQGSLFHASYAGVAPGLLHGAQAECLVLCHEPGRPHLRGLPGYALPALDECIHLNEQHGRLTCPACRVIGLALNTSALTAAEADRAVARAEGETGLPAVDPCRHGVARLVEAMPL